MSNTIVDYKVLKSNIIKCCYSKHKDSIKFEVNFDKLKSLSDDIGLVPVNVGCKSKAVRTDDIPFLSEYYIGQKLEWFEKDRDMTVLTFFVNSELDNEAREMIDTINAPESEVPDADKIHLMAKLTAKYICYFATIVSYKNLDPKFIGKLSYFIICRANKVAIHDQRYKYNPDDMA